MARIDFGKPCTLDEVRLHLRDARYGYTAADNRVYSRHVDFLLARLEELEGCYEEASKGEAYANVEAENAHAAAAANADALAKALTEVDRLKGQGRPPEGGAA
jgi:hypothetical protein